MTAPQAVRRRASKPKVRTGCDRCKARKIKCDETKPQCNRCVRFGAACDYPFRREEPKESRASALTIRPAPAVLPKDSTLRLRPPPSSVFARLTAQDGMYLQYFVRKLSDQFSTLRLGDPAMSLFWFNAILQQGHHDEYVLDGILAIGALAWARKTIQPRIPLIHHRLSGALRNQHYQRALLHYDSAIQKLKPVLSSAPPEAQLQVMYTSSILFLMLEMFQENDRAVDQLGGIGLNCYSRMSPAAMPSYVRSAHSATRFMTSSNIIYVSLSPRAPSIRAAIYPDVSLALQPPAVVGPEISLQEFIASWWRLLTTVINLCVLPAVRDVSSTGPDTAGQLRALLALIGAWKTEAQKRLAMAQEAVSIISLRLIVTITNRFELVVKQREQVNGTPESYDIGLLSSDALEYVSILELFRLCRTPPLRTAGMLCAENEFEVTNEAAHSPALPALLHIARQCPNYVTRLEALTLFRSMLQPTSASNLKAVYMVLRVLADIERPGLTNHYDWTKGFWNDSYSALHVTLTPACCFGKQRPQPRHLVLQVEDYGL